jgi:hypothetical protein
MEISYDPFPMALGVVNFPANIYVDEPQVVGPQQNLVEGTIDNNIHIQGSAAGINPFPQLLSWGGN